MGADDLLVVAGEASGDLHGARLLAELRRLRPAVRPFGLGGDELAAAGLEALAHSSEISVVGLTEVLKVLPRARQIFHRLLEEVDRRGAATAVLIDFPGFNLSLARRLKERGLRVVYYISPQVWAWRRSRIKTIARRVDKMLVVLPFEVGVYRDHGLDVVHVGHPLLDEVPAIRHAWDRPRAVGEPFRVTLLPGSRRSELDALLPTLLASAAALARLAPVRFSLIRAATIPRQELEARLAGAAVEIEIAASQDRFAVMADSHLALCASGTATLEVGLMGTPMVVVYRVGAWTSLLGRFLLRVPYVSLVNLVLDRPAVPELLQSAATPENIARRAAELLADAAGVATMRAALAELRRRLGEGGASRRAAAEVAGFLPAAPTPQPMAEGATT